MKRLLIVLTILIFSHTAFAAHFTVDAIDRLEMPVLTSKQIDITVKSDINDTFLINAVDIKPWMTLGTSSLTVPAGGSEKFNFYVAPTKDLMLGLHKITLNIESVSTGESIEKAIFVKLIKGETLEIEKIVVTGDLQPTGTVTAEIYIKNFKTTTVQDVAVSGSIKSTFSLLDFSDVIDRIDPDQSFIIKKELILEKYAPPGTYYVEATLFDPALGPQSLRQDFTVAQRAIINEQKQKIPFGFGYTKIITITNDGNKMKEDYTVTDALSDFDSTFYFGDKPSSANGGMYYWKLFNMKPGDERTITYTINYLPLLLFIIFIIIAVWYLIFKLCTLRIKKYIMQKKIIEHGSEFTVGVNIKNSSGRAVKDIHIHDFVPSVFSVKDTPGVAPKKKKTGVGIELSWRIAELKHGEERIFSYKIIPVFGVTGVMRLPPAVVNFTRGKKRKKNSSWPAKIGAIEKREK